MKRIVVLVLISFSLILFSFPVLSSNIQKPPSKVEGVRVQQVGLKVKIEWNRATPGDYPIAGYEIYRGTDKIGLYSIGKVGKNITSFVDYNVFLNKTYYYSVSAFDEKNNYSEASDVVSITIVDKSPPDLVILEPEDNNFYTKEDEIDLLIGVRDYESGLKDLKVNGEKINRCGCSTFRKILKLKEGKNEFVIEAVDHAGNRSVKKLIIYKDTTPPKVDILVPDKVYNENLVLKGKITDNLSGVKVLRINGIIVEVDDNGNFDTILLLKEGRNKVIIEALDNMENKIKETFEVTYMNSIEIKLFIGKNYFYVNDKLKKMDVSPVIINGRSFAPVRFIVEGMGGKVRWNRVERSVEIMYKDNNVKLWIDKEFALLNGEKIEIDEDLRVKPFIANGRTMLPVRFIAKVFGFSVSWNPFERSVTLKN